MISIEDESSIRARVVAAIGQKGWSLRHASLQAGMAADTLGKYVRGETRSLSAVHLANLAEVLGVGVMYLLKGAPGVGWGGGGLNSHCLVKVQGPPLPPVQEAALPAFWRLQAATAGDATMADAHTKTQKPTFNMSIRTADWWNTTIEPPLLNDGKGLSEVRRVRFDAEVDRSPVVEVEFYAPETLIKIEDPVINLFAGPVRIVKMVLEDGRELDFSAGIRFS